MPWILVLVLLALAWPGRGEPTDAPHAVADLEVFTRAGCPRCAAAERFLTELQRAQPALRIVVHDVAADAAALARLQEHAGRWLKLISGAVMLGLGMALIALPAWMAG